MLERSHIDSTADRTAKRGELLRSLRDPQSMLMAVKMHCQRPGLTTPRGSIHKKREIWATLPAKQGDIGHVARHVAPKKCPTLDRRRGPQSNLPFYRLDISPSTSNVARSTRLSIGKFHWQLPHRHVHALLFPIKSNPNIRQTLIANNYPSHNDAKLLFVRTRW